MRTMNTKIKMIMAFLFVFMWHPPAFAQGFTKIDIKDKFGSGHTKVEPIEPLQPVEPKQDESGEGANPTVATDKLADGTLPEGMIQLNGTDVDIKEMVKSISTLTGKNFIINDKVRGKITIISEKPMTKEMAYQAFLSALEINGFTTVMTPAGLINIVPQKDSLTKSLDLFTEESPNTDKFITRIVQLENISANEIAQVVKPMISKNGNMFPYPTTNSVIITDTGSNIDSVLRLIHELDTEGPQEVMEIIPIVNADAQDIADKINEIFRDESAAQSASQSAVRRSRVRTAQAEMEDVQSISKVVADERTNSVIMVGTKRSIGKVRALIAILDRTMEGVSGMIHVYYLKYANATDIAEVLSNLVTGSSSTSSKTSGTTAAAAATQAASGSVHLEGNVKVTADESTNALVITASPKDYSTLVEQVISKLDILRPQVYLEAVIMSLNVNKTQTVGVSGLGGIINTLAGGTELNAFGGLLPTTPEAISTIASASGGFGGGVFSTETIDFTLSDGSTASVPKISGIIMALASDTDANVLSTPSIMTMDNEEAQITVGQEVPVPSGTTVSSGVTTFDVTREEVGIILKITPQISEDDTVRMKLEQEISSVFTTDTDLGPTMDTKSVSTVVMAKNRQTIVIGGLIDDKATVSTHKVPFLGDIPVLGNLFKTRVSSKEKTNLIVFITPYIIRERKDYLEILKKKIEERNEFVDANYGKGQQKNIRKSIENHAKELLEFKCIANEDSDPCVSTAATTSTTTVQTGEAYDPPRKTKQVSK